MDLNTSAISSAAADELRRLKRLSYSGEGFSNSEISAIADAIAAAIEEYDRQRNQEG